MALSVRGSVRVRLTRTFTVLRNLADDRYDNCPSVRPCAGLSVLCHAGLGCALMVLTIDFAKNAIVHGETLEAILEEGDKLMKMKKNKTLLALHGYLQKTKSFQLSSIPEASIDFPTTSKALNVLEMQTL